MADNQLPRPKRQGNYTPERIKAIESEVTAHYAALKSAREISREFGISKQTIRNIIERNGLTWRDRKAAGVLCRTVEEVTDAETNDPRSVAQQVAERMGYRSSAGLSYDREFRSACARENRRRNVDGRRELERRRKEFLRRIPAWANRKKIDAFYEMASDLGLEVDHIIPLQGDNICGLHVENNLQLVSPLKNSQKYNKFKCGPDILIGHPNIYVNNRQGC